MLETLVTWKEKQARTRQKLEQSIEVLKSKGLPGQNGISNPILAALACLRWTEEVA